jgi:hypothetical protein
MKLKDKTALVLVAALATLTTLLLARPAHAEDGPPIRVQTQGDDSVVVTAVAEDPVIVSGWLLNHRTDQWMCDSTAPRPKDDPRFSDGSYENPQPLAVPVRLKQGDQADIMGWGHCGDSIVDIEIRTTDSTGREFTWPFSMGAE